MVRPSTMCRKHLLGEHVELHMFVGHLRKLGHIRGYVENNLVEPQSIVSRHAELVEEILRRGYRHESPISEPQTLHLFDQEYEAVVDRDSAAAELYRRCPDCRAEEAKHA